MAEIKNKATLDNKPFNTSIGKMAGRVKGFGKQLAGMGKAIKGGFAIAAFGSLAKGVMASAGEISNLTKQTGLSIEGVQALKIAAEEAGVGFETLRPTINQFRRALDQAHAGSPQMIKAFEDIGVSMSDLRGLDVEGSLDMVTRAMVDGVGSAEVMAASTKLLGAESTRLQGILLDVGNVGVAGLIDRYDELILKQQEVVAADRLQEKTERMTRRVKSRAGGVIAEGVGTIEWLFRRAKGESAKDLDRDIFGIDEEADKAKKEQAEIERKMMEQMAESRAQAQLDELNNERRLRSISQESRNAELNTQIQALNAELASADSAQRRLEITREIAKLEGQIREVKEEANKIDEDQRFNPLRNIGANALGMGSVKVGEGVDPRSREGQKQAARTFEIYGRRQIQQSERMIELMDQTNQALKGGSRL